jgi:hypothetical protein
MRTARAATLLAILASGCGGADAPAVEPASTREANAADNAAALPELTSSAVEASSSTAPTASASASASAAPAGPFDLSPWGQPVLLDPLPGMHVSLEPNPQLLNAIVEADGGLELQVLGSFGKEPTAASQRKVIGDLLQNTRFLEEEQLANGFVIVWETDCAFGRKRETGFALYDRKTKHFCQSARICKSREEIAPLIKTCKSMRPKG